MAFQKFIKENLTLIYLIALPLMLWGAFQLSIIIPKILNPPQYELVLSQNAPLKDGQLLSSELKVIEGKIFITTTSIKTPKKRHINKRLFIFNGQKNQMREILITLPEKEGTFLLEETKDLTINPSETSPDGYSYYYKDGKERTTPSRNGEQNFDVMASHGPIAPSNSFFDVSSPHSTSRYIGNPFRGAYLEKNGFFYKILNDEQQPLGWVEHQDEQGEK